MMFYLPCLYGTFLVGCLGNEINLLSMGIANMNLFLLSFLMRGMLCTWNDVIDQDIDRQVARTRIRPIARGAISTTQAVIWTLIRSSWSWSPSSLSRKTASFMRCLSSASTFYIRSPSV